MRHRVTGTESVSAEKGPRGKPLWLVHLPPCPEEPGTAGAFLHLSSKEMGLSKDFGDASPLRAWQALPAQPFLSPHGYFSSTAGGSHPQHPANSLFSSVAHTLP